METMRVKAGDAELECFSQGTGAGIIMVPGGSLSVGYLSGLADALAAAGLRATRVNPRGAGGSTRPMEGLTLHDFATDIDIPGAGHLQPVEAPGPVAEAVIALPADPRARADVQPGNAPVGRQSRTMARQP